MNCRPGDLAVVIRSVYGESVGKLVRCLRLADLPGLCNPDGSLDEGPVWETDHYGPDAVFDEVHPYWMDKDLRPIRDNDGEDETLTWAGKPQEVTA